VLIVLAIFKCAIGDGSGRFSVVSLHMIMLSTSSMVVATGEDASEIWQPETCLLNTT
jgi:hypothetical protein